MAVVVQVGVEIEVVVGRHVCQSQEGVGWMLGDAEALPKCEMNTLMTPVTPPSRCTALGSVEPNFVGHLVKALAWDATRRFRFLSMQPIGCIPWCSMDAFVDVSFASQ